MIHTNQLAIGVFGGILIGGLILGLSIIRVSFAKPTIVITLWALLPGILLVVLSRFAPIEVPQFAVLTLPAWAAMVALAFADEHTVRGLLSFTVLVLVGLGVQAEYRSPDGHGEATQDLAKIIATNYHTGDVVVFGPTEQEALAGRDIIAHYLPDGGRPKDALSTSTPRTAGNLYPVECSSASACINSASRVWLIRMGQPSTMLDGLGDVKDVLRNNYLVYRAWTFKGLSLTLYSIKPAS